MTVGETSAARRSDKRAWRPLAALLLLVATLCGPVSASAQGSRPETVTWKVELQPAANVAQGTLATVELKGAVLDGWHIYSQEQPAGGPIAMDISLAANPVAVLAGTPKASTPTRALDRSFNLVTQYYASNFTVSVPLRIKPDAVPGRYEVPVDVLYQSCDGQVCLIPKTVRLATVITIRRAN